MKVKPKVNQWLILGRNDKDDLQKAIEDSANLEKKEEKGGKGEKRAKAKTKEKEKEETKDDEEEEESSGGMADAFRKALASSDDEEEEEDEKKEEDDEEEEEESAASDLEEKLEKEELPPGTSSKVSEKFKGVKKIAKDSIAKLKEVEKAKSDLDKKVKELEGKVGQSTDDIEKHPKVVELTKKLKEKEENIQKLSLEDSDWFQEKFDVPRVKLMKKMKPIIQGVDDEHTDTVIAAVEEALRIRPGEEQDALFSRAINKIVKLEGFPEDDRDEFKSTMRKIRDVYNERGEALTNWQSTVKTFNHDKEAGATAQAERYTEAFDLVRGNFLKKNEANFSKIIEQEEVFGYKKITEPVIAEVKSELAITAKTGELTPKLLAHIEAGVEYVFLADMVKKMQGLLQETFKENSKLKKKLGIKEEERPAKGAKEKAKPTDDEEETSGYGMVKSFRKVAGS